MSKTHKITRLKKRIAELEKVLSINQQRISFDSTNKRVLHLYAEICVDSEEYHWFHGQKAYKEHIMDCIARTFTDSADFRKCLDIHSSEVDNHVKFSVQLDVLR